MKVMAQVFLSYAREDERKVENLYQKLSNVGFKPWMDKKDILPGEKWKYCIRKAIRSSDFFLVCLSANSIKKRGWVQREVKQALDILQEMLDSDIYLIPVRLEDCEVPESLRDFQWVNPFEGNGWTQLVKAIRVGMERRAEVIKLTPEEGPEQLVAASHTEAAGFLDKLAELEVGVSIWQRVPRWIRGAAIGGTILLVVAGMAFLSSRGGTPTPAAEVARATTPTVTVTPQPVSAIAGSELLAVVSSTSTPVPPTPTPTPTVAIAATQTALAAEVMATALAQASATVSASIPTPTDTPIPTQTPVPPTATATDTPGPPAPIPTPTGTATDTPRPPATPIPTPTITPQPTGPIALTVYLRDTLTETGFAALSGDQVNGGMIYEEGKFVYGEAAVQIGATTYHFDKPEVGPGEPQQLPDPWQVEFEFAEELLARTGNQAGFDPKKAQFWVGTLDGHSAVGEDHPYSLTMKLYEGKELRKSIQVFFTVADAPPPGGREVGPGGKPPPPP